MNDANSSCIGCLYYGFMTNNCYNANNCVEYNKYKFKYQSNKKEEKHEEEHKKQICSSNCTYKKYCSDFNVGNYCKRVCSSSCKNRPYCNSVEIGKCCLYKV